MKLLAILIFLAIAILLFPGCAGYDAAVVVDSPYGKVTYTLPKPDGLKK